MNDADWIATVAATLTTFSFMPQAVKVLKTKNTAGISLTMYSMFTVGVLFWFVFGVAIESWPIIIANLITLVFASLILYHVAKDQFKR